MDPSTIDPRPDDAGKLWYYQSGGDEPIPAEDVLHIAGLGWDGVRGYSPITIAAEALGLAKAEQTWQSALFGNNATPNGHYEIAGTLRGEARKEFRREVALMHGGPSKAGKFGILDGGAKWVQTSFSPSDAQTHPLAASFRLPKSLESSIFLNTCSANSTKPRSATLNSKTSSSINSHCCLGSR